MKCLWIGQCLPPVSLLQKYTIFKENQINFCTLIIPHSVWSAGLDGGGFVLFAICLVSYYTRVTEPMCRYQYVQGEVKIHGEGRPLFCNGLVFLMRV